MSESSLTLAVYGTLRRGQRNHDLLAGARWLGLGFLSGSLYDVPRTPYRAYPYPAYVSTPQGRVTVEVYELSDAFMLAALDRLEHYLPANEAASQYLRRVVDVIDGPVADAFAYLYNGSPDELGELIPGGDWVSHASGPAAWGHVSSEPAT